MHDHQILVKSLARQNAILKGLLALFIIAFTAGLLMGLRFQDPAATAVATKNLQVVDSQGAVRMQISTDADGTPCFVLSDKGKSSRVRLIVSDKSTPIINLLSGDGTLIWKAP